MSHRTTSSERPYDGEAAARAAEGTGPPRESFPLAVGPGEDHLEQQIIAHHAREDIGTLLTDAPVRLPERSALNTAEEG